MRQRSESYPPNETTIEANRVIKEGGVGAPTPFGRYKIVLPTLKHMLQSDGDQWTINIGFADFLYGILFRDELKRHISASLKGKNRLLHKGQNHISTTAVIKHLDVIADVTGFSATVGKVIDIISNYTSRRKRGVVLDAIACHISEEPIKTSSINAFSTNGKVSVKDKTLVTTKHISAMFRGKDLETLLRLYTGTVSEEVGSSISGISPDLAIVSHLQINVVTSEIERVLSECSNPRDSRYGAPRIVLYVVTPESQMTNVVGDPKIVATASFNKGEVQAYPLNIQPCSYRPLG